MEVAREKMLRKLHVAVKIVMRLTAELEPTFDELAIWS
jgi:hypothetical protein